MVILLSKRLLETEWVCPSLRILFYKVHNTSERVGDLGLDVEASKRKKSTRLFKRLKQPLLLKIVRQANKACTGRLGLGAFLELVLNFGSFRFASWFSPAAGNASRWAAKALENR